MNGLEFFKNITFAEDFGGLGCITREEAIGLLEKGVTVEVSSLYQRLLLNVNSDIDVEWSHVKNFLSYPCHYMGYNKYQITEHGFVD